jgi:hypothetical protein
MTTAAAPTLVPTADGLLVVCSWCIPPPILRDLHRLYKCSDGICESCIATLEREAA